MRGWLSHPRNISILTGFLHRRVVKREGGQCIERNMLTNVA